MKGGDRGQVKGKKGVVTIKDKSQNSNQVVGRGSKLRARRHEGELKGDGTVPYLYCDYKSMPLYICQKSLNCTL